MDSSQNADNSRKYRSAFFFSLVLWIVVSSPPNVVVERSNAEKATSADNVMDVPRINLHANSTK